jgi:hypothetical protein
MNAKKYLLALTLSLLPTAYAAAEDYNAIKVPQNKYATMNNEREEGLGGTFIASESDEVPFNNLSENKYSRMNKEREEGLIGGIFLSNSCSRVSHNIVSVNRTTGTDQNTNYQTDTENEPNAEETI